MWGRAALLRKQCISEVLKPLPAQADAGQGGAAGLCVLERRGGAMTFAMINL